MISSFIRDKKHYFQAAEPADLLELLHQKEVTIKKVLPVLVPSLKYDELEIGDGGTAAEKWNQLVTKDLDSEEKEFIIESLKAYCKLDTYAMYAIWKALYSLIS